MPRREVLPDDLRELCSLCRVGKLFAVQDWIKAGRRFRLPDGHFTTSPLRTSVQSGFHSLVEVLLRAGVSSQETSEALALAVSNRNLDLVELLIQYGAEVTAIDPEEVFWCRHPGIIRCFIENGMDLESGACIAKAFREKHREFLGIYLDLRDRITSARTQAAMALRHHAEQGNLKWVSLLLWAEADARVPVPRIEECDWDEEETDTALNVAIRYGRVEIVKKIGLDPGRDDATRLLNQYFIQPKPEIIELLITSGADVSNLSPHVIDSVFSCFEWSLDTTLVENPTRTEEALRCMEILGSNGVHWTVPDRYRLFRLRRTLARLAPYIALGYLQRIANSRIMEQPVLEELIRAAKTNHTKGRKVKSRSASLWRITKYATNLTARL
jgi:hypothetical protein